MTYSLALIAAHNEEVDIATAIRHVIFQVDEVIVINDRSTDLTEKHALEVGAKVYPTERNTNKKAGALNQALTDILPLLQPDDLVLIQDADSFICPDFFDNARRHIEENDLGACGGVFGGREGGGFVGWAQRNEFARYARDVGRNRGRTLCLTGTATVFKVEALRAICASRDAKTVYDTTALTEDFEVSLRLESLGFTLKAPADCALSTEVMPTWRELARQRFRWKRGAIESLSRYGLNKVTIGHWGRQVWGWLGIVATSIFLLTLIYGLFVGLSFKPIWMIVTGVFVIERSVTVRSRGWRNVLLAALIIPEMPFDLTLQAMHVRAWAAAILRRKSAW